MSSEIFEFDNLVSIIDLADQYGFSANGGVIDGDIAAQLCLELDLARAFEPPNPKFFGIGALAGVVDDRDTAYFVSALRFYNPEGEVYDCWIHVAPKAKFSRGDISIFVKVLADQMELRFAGLNHLTVVKSLKTNENVSL